MAWDKANKVKKQRLQKRLKKAAEAKPPQIKEVIRDIPLTSLEQLKRTRQEINATNRRRAKDMERRVARYLKGKRVPSSGAIAGMKGDCTIPLQNGGFYLVECKLSAQEDVSYGKKIPLVIKWFEKIEHDAQSMNARFGVLVIHYHGQKEDYVFVPEKGMRLLAMRSEFRFTIDLIRNDIIPRDITRVVGDQHGTAGKLRSTYDVHLKKLESWFVDVRGFKSCALLTQFGVWYIFTLEQFRDLMENV